MSPVPPSPAAQLHAALAHPEVLPGLPVPRQELALRMARQAGVLGRLAVGVAEAGAWSHLSPRLQDQLTAARRLAEEHRRMVVWEADRVARALFGLEIPLILLKGAAYALADLPPARGRLLSDLDILVPREELPRVEERLLANGWEATKEEPYDQRYYREWMHELPPMRHRERFTWVDVHHTILPLTSRLRPDAARLMADAQPLPGTPFRVLAPEDMVLHAAAHLFHDGDMAYSLRELVDLDGLLRHFAARAGFWSRLRERSRLLGLELPAARALHFTRALLETPIPLEPPLGGPVTWLMTRALSPDHPDHATRTREAALGCLFVRSHWLRMPPRLLVPHLLRKGWRRWQGEG